MIKITKANYKRIFGKLKKFFNHDNLLSWHQFDCGNKKRYGHYIHHEAIQFGNVVLMPAHTSNVMYKLRDTECVVEDDQFIFYYNDIDFGSEEPASALVLTIGDEIEFLGNRIHVKTKFCSPTHNYCYQCYQLGGTYDERYRR